MYRLFDLGAVRAMGGISFSYPVQVLVERGVLGAE
jgi:hypothetical protein